MSYKLTSQEGQCYIISGGRNYVGPVAAWRNPCILPTNIGMFEAIPWPEHLWAKPDDVMMFAAKGRDRSEVGRHHV